jgi:betaine-aldehyde dehydrogenase
VGVRDGASLFIDGEWTAGSSGETSPVIAPFDGREIERVSIASDEDVQRAIGAARRAFDDGEWAGTPAPERGAILSRIADLLEGDAEEIAGIETGNTGKALREGRYDVADVVKVFRYYAGLADKEAGRLVATGSRDALSRIVYEPIGVCALIGPWNYPLLQVAWKIAPALAAGDTFVVKPASVTPLSAIHLMHILQDVGLPRGVANLVLGPGDRVGQALAESPDVDFVSLTGGIDAGRKIMRAAAGNMKKVAFELGGKSPNIVFDDADFETVVDYALTAAFVHSGQVCSAGTRALVQDSIYDDFVAEVARRTDRIRLGDGFDETTEAGPMISEEHRAKVERYIGIGRAEGARLVAGGGRPTEAHLQKGFFVRPTVFADCNRSMRIVREEIFGPVLTIERFHTEDEAVEAGNDTTYGLAGAVWTADASRAQRVAGRLRHGTIWINDYHPYLPQAEWGGFKQSGIGRELGPTGLDEYREAKHIYQNTAPGPSRWFGG